MSAINATLEACDREGMSFNAVSATGERFGVSFLVPFLRNKLSELEITIATGNARLFRLEVTGYASRMQKAYFEFDADGNLVLSGEEMASVTVTREEGGILRIRAAFVPHQSRLDWLYLFAWPGDSDKAAPSCSFGASTLKYRIEAEEGEQIHGIGDKKVFEGGVMFHVHALQTFRNYLHVEFEIHKQDARLSRLWLIAPEAIEAAQWWTLDLLDPSGHKGKTPEGYELSAQKPGYAIPSPVLMETLGENHGWRGHRITALYRHDGDVRYMDLDQCDARLQKLKLAAEFSDGTVITLPCADGIPGRGDIHAEMRKIERYRIPADDRLPVFVEVGARGSESSTRRRMIEGPYQYIGVDLLPGENVDRVGEAHLLSEMIELKSADVVYTHSVLEHLIAPIKFILEANKILRPGGLFISHAPTCWPLHAEPRDFWRFSAHTWAGLLNAMTGFEILEIREYGDASIIPTISVYSGFSKMQCAPTPLFTSVFARKISEAGCEYSVWSPDLAAGRYD